MKILHVIPDLVNGGGAIALVRFVEWLAGQCAAQEVLTPGPIHPRQREALAAAGAGIIGAAEADAEISRAGIVLLHYWHAAPLQRLLMRRWPACRIVAWTKIAGDCAPQVVGANLAGFVDRLVACSPVTLGAPGIAMSGTQAEFVPSLGNLGRIRPREAEPPGALKVGYIGVLDFIKLHRGFVSMSAAVDRDIEVPIWGEGTDADAIRGEAARTGCPDRFAFHGWTQDVSAALASVHVFGYPIARHTYAAAEGVLQEAMYAGVPPAVFDRACYRNFVLDGQTALVAKTEADYVAAITALVDDVDLRQRIGRGAHAFVARELVPERHYARLLGILADVVATQPRREHVWPRCRASGHSGADIFVSALDQHSGVFAKSLAAPDADAGRRADEEIAAAPAGIRSPGAGGLFDYRRTFPDDAMIAFWCGLSEFGRGAFNNALAHILGARQLGLSEARIGEWTRAAHAEVTDARRRGSRAALETRAKSTG